MERRRVLIIAYYWPPSGGSGVQRWLKFTKYLRDFGWEPVIYTPANPEYMALDNSLQSEIPEGVQVVKREILEPYSIYRALTGKKKGEIKPGFINSGGGASLFIRSNLFVPDPKCLWIYPSRRFLKKWLRDNPVDAIVSTGPPHSMHLIAKGVAKSLRIPWIADFRDPWTKMFTFKYMKYSAPVKALHSMLERRVVRGADVVLTVTSTIARELEEVRIGSAAGKGGEADRLKVPVITNGYDPADFPEGTTKLDKEFSITYTGLFVKSQNPVILWGILSKWVKQDPDFASVLKIRLVGHTDGTILQSIEEAELTPYLERIDYMSHDKVTELQSSSQLLLLSGGMEPESRGILTGKFFEYLAARRPIIGFGPKGGDMDIALGESEGGAMFDYDDERGARRWLEDRYAEYLAGGIPPADGNIENYSRRELTRRLALILDEITRK
ncbi:MAG: glycosyltransferase [Bacteroidales bacterium]|nr:glycosyltransferase [Bacteroidales bacterium]